MNQICKSNGLSKAAIYHYFLIPITTSSHKDFSLQKSVKSISQFFGALRNDLLFVFTLILRMIYLLHKLLCFCKIIKRSIYHTLFPILNILLCLWFLSNKKEHLKMIIVGRLNYLECFLCEDYNGVRHEIKITMVLEGLELV